MTQEYDPEDMRAAEFALGLLPPDEMERAQKNAVSDPDFMARVTEWQMRLSQMADLDPVTPPAALKAAILRDLFPGHAPQPIWRRLGIWQALTGGAVAAALALAVVVWQSEGAGQKGPLYSAEIVSQSGDFRVVALVDKTRNEVTLTRTAGAAPQGRILQVWAHGPDAPAQSVGLWPEGESVRLALPLEIAQVAGTLTLGVSEEPPGGSLTGSPSGRVFGTVDIPNVASDI